MNGRYQTFHLLVERFRSQLEQLSGGGGEPGGVSTVARAMLLLDQGFSLRDTAYATGLCNARVEHFRRRFLCLGLPGLSDAPPLSKQRSLPQPPVWPMRGAA
jgi:hypothetical protein